MNYKIIPSDKFKRETRRLIKKYPSLRSELKELGKTLEISPKIGTSLGNEIYKIRLAIKSKGKGKSGGARVITYIVTENNEVYLLTIYYKSEFDNIDDKTIKTIVGNLNFKIKPTS